MMRKVAAANNGINTNQYIAVQPPDLLSLSFPANDNFLL
jgi:hypothetical protein